MEYVYFSVIVVSLGAVLAFWAVRSARPGNPQAARAAGGRPGRGGDAAHGIRFEREADPGAKADMPPSWAGAGPTRPGGSAVDAGRGLGDRLGDWVEALLQQKRTVDDEDYRVRTNESFRTLVEDRYARRSAVRTSPPRGREVARERTAAVRTPWGW